ARGVPVGGEIGEAVIVPGDADLGCGQRIEHHEIGDELLAERVHGTGGVLVHRATVGAGTVTRIAAPDRRRSRSIAAWMMHPSGSSTPGSGVSPWRER